MLVQQMRLVILALDQSITQSGVAWYEAPGDERWIRCASFSCSAGADDDEKCALFAQAAKKLIGRKPRADFICWERASQRISMYKKQQPAWLPDDAPAFTVNPASTTLLHEIQGIIRGLSIAYRIPHESVAPNVWRAALYGTGGGKLTKPQAKAKAKQYCRQLGISFSNENEAEAACIARWAATCSQRFKMLRFTGEAA
jgi:hypothetical protein